MDVEAVEAAVARAASVVRGGGPAFLELVTYRFRAHSMYDPDLYRPKEEIAAWRERDPLTTYPALLRERGLLDDAAWEAMEAQIRDELDAAIAAAEASPLEPIEELERFVLAEEAPR
jgi:pyruvate dehydrogenase E1 component alpha subunit